MATDTTLTSYIHNPWDGTVFNTDQIKFDYSNLGFTPSTADSYKSTSGDVFKVYVGGVRIYRSSDVSYAGGTGFLEDGDISGSKLNGLTSIGGGAVSWASTSDLVWYIDTANQVIYVDQSAIAATALYGSNGKNVTFTSGSTIIELRRGVQDESGPSVDFSNASILTEQDLDNSSKNVFHMAQQAVVTAEKSLPYSTGTNTYEAYQPGTTTKRKITQVADGTDANDAANYGQLTANSGVTNDAKLEALDWAKKVDGGVKAYSGGSVTGGEIDHSAKAWSIGGTGVTDTASKGAAKEWAIETSGNVDGTSFSAKEYAQGTQASTGGSAKDYAQKVDGGVSGATSDHSAKAWAVGGTGVTTTASKGASKEWAIATGLVDTANYSSKTYAQSATAGTGTYGGSAKGWASTAYDTAVPGAGADDRSALHYATDASNSATSAKNSAASVSNIFDSFDDTYLGRMADTDSQGTNPTTNGTWAKNSSTITVVSGSNIKVGQVVTGTGIPTSPKPNVLSVDGTTVIISENMVAAGSAVALTFTGYGVYGDYNNSKDGPALNNDGDALASGNLYFNSTDNEMRIYDGANWIAATSAGDTSLLEYKFVTTSAQVTSKTYSGSADVGGTLSYTQDNIIVFMNGVQLKNGVDYTATNGTSIVLTNSAAVSDEIAVIAFKSFTASDAVSRVSGGTFASAVTFSAGLSAGDANITNVGSIALDSIVADGTSITISSDMETATNKKIKQKGAFMQSSTHQSWVLGG